MALEVAAWFKGKESAGEKLEAALSLVEDECYATTAIEIALSSYASSDLDGTRIGIEKARKELQCSLQDESEACELLEQAALGL